MSELQSPTIAKLAEALAAAQGQFPVIHKDKTAKVGQYSYNYADLATVLGAVTPVLSKNGLALTQSTRWDMERLAMLLETRLMHTSGEWISASYPLPTAAKPQEMGSAVTYARRYSVTAILGIATEDDDDGAGAQTAAEKDGARKGKPKDESRLDKATATNGNGNGHAETISVEQAATIRKLIADAGISNADAGAEIKRVCGAGVKSVKEIPAPLFDAVRVALEKARAHEEMGQEA